ncbi:MAG: hypothetical protein IJV81_01110 [Paludibacteraceae bacterium]|nr:hypothetical protein [Paludibacteraceae bacterium]MBQ9751416.1 hypothetical protein [Paludibacteraceae bacterium]
MSKEVVISNSSLNAYGFRVLTEGIDTTQYQRNPILLWMHNRPYRGTTDEVLPLGRIENLRVEGDCLIGTPVFDEQDEFAMRIKSKWDQGILKMVSAGIEILEWSDDPSVLVIGQRRATVTKCKLEEVSIVDIGANDDAITLYKEGQVITLSAGHDDEALNFMNLKKQEKDMKQIALKLGLPADATEQEILSKIAELQGAAQEGVTLRKERDEMALTAIEKEVDEAIALRKLTADKKDHFVTMGKKMGIESLRETLKCMAPAERPSEVIKPTSGASEYVKLSDVPTDKLEALRKDNPDMYATLYKAEYGVELPKV